MKRIIFFGLFITTVALFGQPNCAAFKQLGEELKYKACIEAEERRGHYQFSKEYQEALDRALEIDPTFAYAYQAKSIAYLKSGDFLQWKYLMDKAVEFDPKGQLGYRGWCRYQFFRDYEGAIQDIERLDALVDHEIGFSANGDYQLHIARALCYKAIGQKQKAIEIIENQLQDESHFLGVYDYLHLGVLYLEINEYEKAIEAFKKQEKENDLAENRFYMALAYKELKEKETYFSNLNAAKEKYLNNNRMFDPYVEQMDKIFLADIEKELASGLQQRM